MARGGGCPAGLARIHGLGGIHDRMSGWVDPGPEKNFEAHDLKLAIERVGLASNKIQFLCPMRKPT